MHQILRTFADGVCIGKLLGAYPTLTREDVLACLGYAASLSEEQVAPLDEVVLVR